MRLIEEDDMRKLRRQKCGRFLQWLQLETEWLLPTVMDPIEHKIIRQKDMAVCFPYHFDELFNAKKREKLIILIHIFHILIQLIHLLTRSTFSFRIISVADPFKSSGVGTV